MEGLAKNETITVYYFGDINSSKYKCTVTTVRALQDYEVRTRDIAFILVGRHRALESHQVEKYIQQHELTRLRKSDLL